MMPGQIGRIGWKSIEMIPGRIGQIGWKSIEMMPNLTNLTTQFDHQFDRFDQAGIQHNLNGFPPNSTRQAYNVISMDFHPIQPI